MLDAAANPENFIALSFQIMHQMSINARKLLAVSTQIHFTTSCCEDMKPSAKLDPARHRPIFSRRRALGEGRRVQLAIVSSRGMEVGAARAAPCCFALSLGLYGGTPSGSLPPFGGGKNGYVAGALRGLSKSSR